MNDNDVWMCFVVNVLYGVLDIAWLTESSRITAHTTASDDGNCQCSFVSLTLTYKFITRNWHKTQVTDKRTSKEKFK
ncbi:hypothetical protein Tco_0968051 [Tanacetum coccineum]